jgi:hypothetical protein
MKIGNFDLETDLTQHGTEYALIEHENRLP